MRSSAPKMTSQTSFGSVVRLVYQHARHGDAHRQVHSVDIRVPWPHRATGGRRPPAALIAAISSMTAAKMSRIQPGVVMPSILPRRVPRPAECTVGRRQ